jgi:hypothetical protein
MSNALDTEALEAEAAAEGASAAGKRTYVQRIFSEIAPRYDLLNRLLSLGIDKRWRTIALKRLGWDRAPKGTYLDLCAGTLDVGASLGSAAASSRPISPNPCCGPVWARPRRRCSFRWWPTRSRCP